MEIYLVYEDYRYDEGSIIIGISFNLENAKSVIKNTTFNPDYNEYFIEVYDSDGINDAVLIKSLPHMDHDCEEIIKFNFKSNIFSDLNYRSSLNKIFTKFKENFKCIKEENRILYTIEYNDVKMNLKDWYEEQEKINK